MKTASNLRKSNSHVAQRKLGDLEALSEEAACFLYVPQGLQKMNWKHSGRWAQERSAIVKRQQDHYCFTKVTTPFCPEQPLSSIQPLEVTL